jgi:hypothetical protein
MNKRYANLQERIIANSVIEGDCWIWIGTRNNNGYGRISIRENGKHVKRLAHRVSFEAFIRPLDATEELGHSLYCLSRACVNPGHVAPISHSENIAQIWKKAPRRVREEEDGRGVEDR